LHFLLKCIVGKKHQLSRYVPTSRRAPDRVVEEDLEELCIPENDVRDDDDNDDGGAVSGDYGMDNGPFHFASSNFCQPRIMDMAFEPTHVDQVLETNTYSVVTPAIGSLICGIPVHSKRGISLSKWWIAPEPFLELFKLLQSNRTGYTEMYTEMRRLQWRPPKGVAVPYHATRFFQELALCAVFDRPLDGPPEKVSQKCQLLFAALKKIVE
jgi:hypothetical protein